MPRPRKSRNVCHFPRSLSFSPSDSTGEVLPVILSVDEYETIRLIDHQGFSQEQCCAFMQVARTTVQQIYTSARRKLADMLGVGRDQTIAVGDTTNDTSIVKAAALGLATGNAMEALKEIADQVICTNEEHSARYVLEHYL